MSAIQVLGGRCGNSLNDTSFDSVLMLVEDFFVDQSGFDELVAVLVHSAIFQELRNEIVVFGFDVEIDPATFSAASTDFDLFGGGA